MRIRDHDRIWLQTYDFAVSRSKCVADRWLSSVITQLTTHSETSRCKSAQLQSNWRYFRPRKIKRLPFTPLATESCEAPAEKWLIPTIANRRNFTRSGELAIFFEWSNRPVLRTKGHLRWTPNCLFNRAARIMEVSPLGQEVSLASQYQSPIDFCPPTEVRTNSLRTTFF